MNESRAMLPPINQLPSEGGWYSVHDYLPINSRTDLLVVYEDMHGSGVTSAFLERGRFLSTTNRALVKGVRTWKYMQG